jgi:CheY-like chemotaxis protein
LPRIFNRLTQKDSSTTRTHDGLGLGLAIVRHLVDAHGGTVRAESPGPGRGAAFHVTLPVLVAPPASLTGSAGRTTNGPGARDTGPRRLDGRRILVLEDDEGIRHALAEMLSQTGASVMTAESAVIGMTIFQQFQPDALICDIAMPIEDGYAFIRRIRTLSAAKGGNTPALALTAMAGEGNQRRALAEGFQMYLVKPVDMKQLADSMAAIIEGGPAAVLAPPARGQHAKGLSS